MSALEDLLKDDVRLPSPPAIAARILEIVKREDFTFRQLAAIIQSDPALAARILRLANSGFYSLPKKVSNIDTAVAVLGLNTLKNIALSFIISEAFDDTRGRFDFDRFWRRSITAAVAGELIATAVHFKNDETFISTLLQDIGVAAMFVCRGEEYVKVLEDKALTGLPISKVERQAFGFDHQEAGAWLLQNWGLPESVYLPIRYHHDPESAPPHLTNLCNIVRASDRLAAIYYGSNQARNVRSATEMLSKKFGLPEGQAAELIDAVAEKSIAILSQFEVEPGNIRPFSQILQEANEELSRLNLSYQMLVLEHKEAKEKAERLALELKAANDRLRDLAFRDGLTDLYNHRYFQEAIAREVTRADRYQRPFCLVMFDLDNFKRINDTWGHQRGDLVLQMVAQEIKRNTRKSDLIARYGGEEFAMILHEAKLPGALSRAEVCRAAIAAAQIQADGFVIRTTISAGVAVYDPAQPIGKDQLLAAADQALYRSKRAGRNRVSG
jgi:diguanylate cyclase (GGDEF)-like protein